MVSVIEIIAYSILGFMSLITYLYFKSLQDKKEGKGKSFLGTKKEWLITIAIVSVCAIIILATFAMMG